MKNWNVVVVTKIFTVISNENKNKEAKKHTHNSGAGHRDE